MEFKDFLHVIKTRRSIRNFKPDPVPDDLVKKILEVARWAMSGANGQPWEFVVVKDATLRKKVVDIYEESRYTTHLIEATRAADLRHPGACHSPEKLIRFRNAPIIIIVCGDPRSIQASVLAASFLRGAKVFDENLANATQMICLAASVAGLGAEWVSLSPPSDERIKTALGIPDIFRIYTIVPIGYPSYKPAAPYRRKLEDIVHWDTYDMSKFRKDEQIIEFIRALRKHTKPSYEV